MKNRITLLLLLIAVSHYQTKPSAGWAAADAAAEAAEAANAAEAVEAAEAAEAAAAEAEAEAAAAEAANAANAAALRVAADAATADAATLRAAADTATAEATTSATTAGGELEGLNLAAQESTDVQINTADSEGLLTTDSNQQTEQAESADNLSEETKSADDEELLTDDNTAEGTTERTEAQTEAFESIDGVAETITANSSLEELSDAVSEVVDISTENDITVLDGIQRFLEGLKTVLLSLIMPLVLVLDIFLSLGGSTGNLVTPQVIETIKSSVELLGQTPAEATATVNDAIGGDYVPPTDAQMQDAFWDFAAVKIETGAEEFLAKQGYDAPLEYNRTYALSVLEGTGDLMFTDPVQYELLLTSLQTMGCF